MKYTKDEVKAKLKAEEIQLFFDDKSKLELLRYLLDSHFIEGRFRFYSLNHSKVNEFLGVEIIKISDIVEDSSKNEEIFLISDMQFREIGTNEWFNCTVSKNFEYRIKPKPDYNKEIEALQLKAFENGMKVLIEFEKL